MVFFLRGKRFSFEGTITHVGMTNTTDNKDGTMAKPGQKPRITPSDVEAQFHARGDVAEPLTASEISEELNCTRRTVLTKLNTLQESDAVKSKKVGGRARVWWVPVERGDLEPTGDVEAGTVTETETDDVDAQRREASEQLFYDVELPGDGGNLEARRKAIQQIHTYLKENGRGQKSDFEEIVDAEACGYGGSDPFNSFWTNCVTVPGTLAALPDVEPPGEGGHVYQYVGGGEQ